MLTAKEVSNHGLFNLKSFNHILLSLSCMATPQQNRNTNTCVSMSSSKTTHSQCPAQECLGV
jgi:hypothetical protein